MSHHVQNVSRLLIVYLVKLVNIYLITHVLLYVQMLIILTVMGIALHAFLHVDYALIRPLASHASKAIGIVH